jgi:hypothetical protein
MHKMIKINALKFVIPVLGLLLSACTTQNATVVDSGAFRPEVDTLYLMPLVDARTDKSSVFDADDIKRVRDSAAKHLEALGYAVNQIDAWKTEQPVADDALANMTADDLCKLAPPDATVFLVITIDHVSAHYLGLAASYSIKGTAVAINLAQRKEIWRHGGSASRGMVGVSGSLISQIAKKAGAQGDLMDAVFSSFPKKGTN